MDYRIKKGNHYSNKIIPKITLRKNIDGNFKFNGDASYEIEKQKDANKIIGISDGYWHRYSSIRLGWRWNKTINKLQLVLIQYDKGVPTRTPLNHIETDVEYEFTISITKDEYITSVNGLQIITPRKSRWILPRYILYPYFGGTTKAPKDFNIEINYKMF
jgi:hypothetical protein